MSKPTDMKKILCTLILFACFFISNAQINKGSILLGGSIGGGTVKTEYGNDKSTQSILMIQPAIGYTYKTNTVIGVKLNYGHQLNKYTGSQYRREVTVYGGGMFYRKYLPLGKAFYLFGEAGIDYAYASIRDDQGGNQIPYNEKQSTITLGLSPGISFAVNKKIHLEASINDILTMQYGHSKKTYQTPGIQDQNTSVFNILANANPAAPVALGIRFVIGK
jgi:hypothetical protein